MTKALLIPSDRTQGPRLVDLGTQHERKITSLLGPAVEQAKYEADFEVFYDGDSDAVNSRMARWDDSLPGDVLITGPVDKDDRLTDVPARIAFEFGIGLDTGFGL